METMQSNTTDRKSTRLNSSHTIISYAVFCLKKKQQRKVVVGQGQGAPRKRCPAQPGHRPGAAAGPVRASGNEEVHGHGPRGAERSRSQQGCPTVPAAVAGCRPGSGAARRELR